MNIGIIGAGNMGSALGKIWANNGHQVLFSYARDFEKLKALAASVNGKAGTPAEAAFADVIFLAVPWTQLEDALKAAGTLADKVLITCVSGLKPDFAGQTMGLPTNLKTSVAEQIAQLAPGAAGRGKQRQWCPHQRSCSAQLHCYPRSP